MIDLGMGLTDYSVRLVFRQEIHRSSMEEGNQRQCFQLQPLVVVITLQILLHVQTLLLHLVC